jgi:hypothetical protein
MRQLETRLGVRLLNRTTRSVSVTDAGQRLLEQLRPALGQISDALEDLNRERSRPFGRLRIYAINTAGAGVIAPVWQRFLSTYPEVHLELQLGEAPVDIVAKGFDAGVGTQDRAAADMVAVRVTGPLKVAVVGAPSYFARRPRPRIPDDLERLQNDLLVLGGRCFEGGKRRLTLGNSLQLATAPSACPLLRGQPTGPEHCCQIEPVHEPQLVRSAGGRRHILLGHPHHGLHIAEHHGGDILGLLVIEIGRARCQRRLDPGQGLGAEPPADFRPVGAGVQ